VEASGGENQKSQRNRDHWDGGKICHPQESYKSLNEALFHAGLQHDVKVAIQYIDPEELEKPDVKLEDQFKGLQAIIVPGGFGIRGTEGKMIAIRYAREKKIPYLGICLGMQLACVEFARNVCNLKDAQSQEFDGETKNPVIHYMHGQSEDMAKGGTMRLGAYPCKLSPSSLSAKLYEKQKSASAIDIAWNSIMPIVKNSRPKGCKLQGYPLMKPWWKSWNSRIIRFLWVYSSIRNFSPSL